MVSGLASCADICDKLMGDTLRDLLFLSVIVTCPVWWGGLWSCGHCVVMMFPFVIFINLFLCRLLNHHWWADVFEMCGWYWMLFL